jgi:hypothetical protein
MFELKVTTQNIKEDLNRDMKNLRKKNLVTLVTQKTQWNATPVD